MDGGVLVVSAADGPMPQARELLSSCDFPGGDIPVIKGSALAVLEDSDPKIGKEAILELVRAVDGSGGFPAKSSGKGLIFLGGAVIPSRSGWSGEMTKKGNML